MCYARRQRSSWARIKLSKNGIWNVRRHLISFFELDCSFTFCLSSILFQRIHEICSCTYFYALYFSHCCSIFNDRTTFQSFSLPLFATAWLLYHNVFALSIPFLKFFKTFFSVDFVSLWYVALSATRILYHTLTLSVNCEFFQIQASYTIHISFFVQKA